MKIGRELVKMEQSKHLLQPVYEKWEVQKIFDLVKNNEFKNPLVNRKKKWVIHSHKTKKQSNYNDYIDFLFTTGSTVENITLARMCNQEKIYYVNIDGNNRLNALLYFFKYPLKVKCEYFNEIYSSKTSLIIKYLKEINYPSFIEIKTLDRFFQKSDDTIKNIWNSLEKELQNKFEDILEEVHKKLKLCNGNHFHTSVHINMMIFEKPTYTDLCNIYTSINSGNNPLTKTDIHAALLWNFNNFEIENKSFEIELKDLIENYYDSKTVGEELESAKYNKEQNLNGFEFFIAFQNYLHTNKCKLVPFYSGKDNNLIIQKLFGELESLEEKSFTTEIIANFIEKVKKSVELISEMINSIINTFINKDNFASNTLHFKLSNNSLFLLINIIFGLEKYKKKEILQIITSIFVYHQLCSIIKNEEEKKKCIVYNILQYHAGGEFILGLARKSRKTPIEKVNRCQFKKLLNILNNEFKNELIFSKKPKRRRKLNLFAKLILTVYYNENIPKNASRKDKSIEHIIPFSSKWKDEELLCIDRLGNLAIINASTNYKRGNRSIDYLHQNLESSEITAFDIPSNQKYNEIVEFTSNKNLAIKDISNYNNFCEEREKKMIYTILDFMYR
tara:strand:+ start:2401 stop:4251 length:1851 start_codon:yes stop_codon:yes gene_type:complete